MDEVVLRVTVEDMVPRRYKLVKKGRMRDNLPPTENKDKPETASPLSTDGNVKAEIEKTNIKWKTVGKRKGRERTQQANEENRPPTFSSTFPCTN